MSQATFDDDDLFEDAASEMREDVETSLSEAREALPEADAIWEVEADNTLGVLNALRSALDVEDAEDHLVDAKKWYTMGERADAFQDAEDLAEEIEAVEDLIDDVSEAHEGVSDLASTVPQLRSALEEFEADDAEADDAETESDEEEADAEADADAEEAEA
jgi:flagellin-specific chaperone FliS